MNRNGLALKRFWKAESLETSSSRFKRIHMPSFSQQQFIKKSKGFPAVSMKVFSNLHCFNATLEETIPPCCPLRSHLRRFNYILRPLGSWNAGLVEAECLLRAIFTIFCAFKKRFWREAFRAWCWKYLRSPIALYPSNLLHFRYAKENLFTKTRAGWDLQVPVAQVQFFERLIGFNSLEKLANHCSHFFGGAR